MENVSNVAFKLAKKNKKQIIDKFIGNQTISNKKPVFIFMAGAPYEGRKVEKQMFIDSLFKSIDNVNAIKLEYKDKVEVWLVEKDISNKTKNIKFDIDNIDNHLKLKYTTEVLNELLYEKNNQ